MAEANDPEDYNEAVKHIEWQKAIQKELDSLKMQDTWKKTMLPNDTKEKKWMFWLKQDNSKKTTVVAKGFQQEYLDDVYSPKAKLSKIILGLSHA